MKKHILSFIFLFSVIAICFSLASCKGGIDRAEAKAFINDFFSCIENEDYEKAATFLHPSCNADLKSFFESIEEAKGIDFQSGISVEKYTAMSYSFYDSRIGGSMYQLTMIMKIGESSENITVAVVKNSDGYGISKLKIENQHTV